MSDVVTVRLCPAPPWRRIDLRIRSKWLGQPMNVRLPMPKTSSVQFRWCARSHARCRQGDRICECRAGRSIAGWKRPRRRPKELLDFWKWPLRSWWANGRWRAGHGGPARAGGVPRESGGSGDDPDSGGPGARPGRAFTNHWARIRADDTLMDLVRADGMWQRPVMPTVVCPCRGRMTVPAVHVIGSCCQSQPASSMATSAAN